MRYLSTILETPQSQPIPGTIQVQNDAGGYIWLLDDWTRLDRFLILGTEGGSYYASEHALTFENVRVVERCAAEDGPRTVARIVEMSTTGRAPKNAPALYALAVCASVSDAETRRLALEALPQVARIGTHLFHFLAFVHQRRGWGRALRRAVAHWYTEKEIDALAYQLLKYQQRDGWSHRDVLRVSHPQATSPEMGRLFAWAVGHPSDTPIHPQVDGVLALTQAQTPMVAASIIRQHGLPREVVPTALLTVADVWRALLDEPMGLTALLRNLATLTRVGVFQDEAVVQSVCHRITDADALSRARVHPIQVLAALLTYSQGHGMRSQQTWEPHAAIRQALETAFYASFGAVEPTGQRWLLGLDVSGSMGMGTVAGVPGLTPRLASAALAMLTVRTEPHHALMAFAHEFVPLHIGPEDTLAQALKTMSTLPFGGTDCALPMQFARAHRIPVDVFVVLTDSETWAGSMHPVRALQTYRAEMGIPAKLIVVGLVSNGFSIADPNDVGMLDVVGFDLATPELMRQFALG